MKNIILIFGIISSVVMSTSCFQKPTKSENNFIPISGEEARYIFSSRMADIAISFEEMKKKNNQKYPNWNLTDLAKWINTMYGPDDKIIRQIKFSTNGEVYTIWIISNYAVSKNAKLTVMKISNGKIYWKDNIAKPSSLIEDIDWNKVTFLVDDMTDEKSILFKFSLPDYIK